MTFSTCVAASLSACVVVMSRFDTLLSLWPSGCLDMVALEGQFTFTAARPTRGCAAFFIAEPDQVLSLFYDRVNINCRGGDFIKVSSRLGPSALHADPF